MFRKTIIKLLRVLSNREIKNRQYAIGVTSYIDTKKNIHMAMLDYDTKNIKEVLDDSYDLASFWNLGDFEIYSTMNGYHVFFWWDIIPYSRLRMILDYSHCDPMYKYISKRFEHKTIRANGKYKENDIKFMGKFSGTRNLSHLDIKRGNLKKQEYLLLKDMKIFNDKVLK